MSKDDEKPRAKPSAMRQARLKCGLSLKEAAQKARITPKYLGDMERTGDVSYRQARNLCQIYGCSMRVFFLGREC